MITIKLNSNLKEGDRVFLVALKMKQLNEQFLVKITDKKKKKKSKTNTLMDIHDFLSRLKTSIKQYLFQDFSHSITPIHFLKNKNVLLCGVLTVMHM